MRLTPWCLLSVLLAACSDASTPEMNAMSGGSGGQAGAAGMSGGGQSGQAGTAGTSGGGSGGSGGQGGAMVMSGGAGGGGIAPPACTDRMIQTEPSTRDLMLLIDGGGNMDAMLSGEPGVSRWTALLQAISDAAATAVDPGTRLGMAVYGTGDMCPLPFEYDLPSEEMGSTFLSTEPPANSSESPTAEAIAAITEQLAPSLHTLVIVTDSNPTRCQEGSGPEGWTGAIMAALSAADAGFRVVLVPIDTELSRSDAQRFANAGSGVSIDAERGATLPMITTQAELSAALGAALKIEVPCEVKLDAVVRAEQACDGEVTLDGSALACDDDDGFSHVDPDRIALHGSACEAFAAGASLTVHYPCEALIVAHGGP